MTRAGGGIAARIGFRLALATGVLLLVPGVRAETATLELARAEFRLGDEASPPGPDAVGWQAVSLPDDWSARRPEAAGIGWYRLTFDLDETLDEPQAVYLESVSMNASVWLNGSLIGQEGRMEPPVAQNWNRPLLFNMPLGLLERGPNVLSIRLHRLADCYGGLGPVTIGDTATLSALHANSHFWSVEVARASTITAALFALIMLAFWIGSRDPIYSTFAALCITIAANDLNFHVRDIPISSAHWEALVCSAAILSAAWFWLFAQRFAGRRRTRAERMLFAYGALSLALFLVDHRTFHLLFNALGLVAVGLAIHATAVIARHARDTDPPMAFVYAGVAVLTLSFVGHDLAVQLGWIRQPERLFYPWIGTLLVVAFGAGLTRRFIRAFRDAEDQRDILAKRVEEKREELELRYAEVEALGRERVLNLERERIMREMHDGVGGHLVRTLSMLEVGDAPREVLTDGLREALDDMRLVIDSIDPNVDDLGIRLGMLRTRLERSLIRSHLELEWLIDPAADAPALGAEASLHVLRIVQEAVTNAVRHANPTRLRVAMRAQRGPDGEPGVAVEVIDDGVGRTPNAKGGRGLANMRRRAQFIGAQFEMGLAENGSGTRVAIWIPCN